MRESKTFIVDVLKVQQKNGAFFLMTFKAWELYKIKVMKAYQEDEIEDLEEAFKDWMDDHATHPVTYNEYVKYVEDHKLEVNETENITSFFGDLIHF